VTNAWQPEPAQAIAPKNIDRWCVNAVFGSAMKVEYTTPDATKVLFIADQLTFASPSARCEVSGPSAAILECRTHIQKHRFDDSRAVFTLIGRGNAGGTLPTVSCAFVYDSGSPNGVIRGDLCSGVPDGFDGPARVVEASGDRRSFLCADVKLTVQNDQHGSFLVIKGTRRTAQ
jgi:hypothetical protein